MKLYSRLDLRNDAFSGTPNPPGQAGRQSGQMIPASSWVRWPKPNKVLCDKIRPPVEHKQKSHWQHALAVHCQHWHRSDRFSLWPLHSCVRQCISTPNHCEISPPSILNCHEICMSCATHTPRQVHMIPRMRRPPILTQNIKIQLSCSFPPTTGIAAGGMAAKTLHIISMTAAIIYNRIPVRHTPWGSLPGRAQ